MLAQCLNQCWIGKLFILLFCSKWNGRVGRCPRRGLPPEGGCSGAPDHSSRWTGRWQRCLPSKSPRATLGQDRRCSHAHLYQPVSMLEKQYFPSTFGDGDLHQGMTGDTKSGDLYTQWEVICGIGVGFRDAVSLITRRTWVRGGAKSKAPLSGRSQAFLRTPGFSWRRLCAHGFVWACAWCVEMRAGGRMM